MFKRVNFRSGAVAAVIYWAMLAAVTSTARADSDQSHKKEHKAQPTGLVKEVLDGTAAIATCS